MFNVLEINYNFDNDEDAQKIYKNFIIPFKENNI